ncbi:hypothetical protein [Enterovirga rhinocerotis]|uniref:Uncharacterized protein n=1 Tax=Enterovirga rhinocerotis TaxID=1339210 RepID=A0A4R7BWZ5_9HYPH|nr:hypothetical protein [Enterovirga rhinocerotis]TDR89722.1 hypothetical protein EV668_2557 [Enterovirga rhinocerotis]
MSGWEMVVFVGMVATAFVAVVAVAWRIQRTRNPERFRESFRRPPMPGSPNHWNRPR